MREGSTPAREKLSQIQQVGRAPSGANFNAPGFLFGESHASELPLNSIDLVTGNDVAYWRHQTDSLAHFGEVRC
jgi:hypothetical protein